MSWLYSQVLVAESSEVKCLDGSALVPWKWKDTHVGFLCKDKTMARSVLSRYGRTSEHSPNVTTTADSTSSGYSASDISWLFPAVSHARIFQWLGKVQAFRANAVAYGEKCAGWLAKYDPATCTWRTAQCSLLGDLTEYSETFPNWGMMLNGVCWPLRTLEPTTSGTGYGCWLTPSAMSVQQRSEESMDKRVEWRKSQGRNTVPPGNLAEQVAYGHPTKDMRIAKENKWQSATCSDAYTDNLKSSQQKPGSMHSVTLAQKVHWPTPTTQEVEHPDMETTKTGRRKSKHGKSSHSICQADAVKVEKPAFPTPWVSGEENYDSVSKRKGHAAAVKHNLLAAVTQKVPTPNSADAERGGTSIYDCNSEKQADRTLVNYAKHYPTPAAQDGKNSTLPVSQRNRDSIPGQLLKEGVQPGAQLNPDWVELLMMWPKGWTDIIPQRIDIDSWVYDYDLNSHLTTAWEQDIPRVGVDIPNRVARIKAIGNGQVPRCAAGAFVILYLLSNGKEKKHDNIIPGRSAKKG